MMVPKKFLMLVLGLLLVLTPVANAEDDFDAEVEESMAERDATTAQARAMKLRAEKEEAETEARKKEAQKMKAAADARHKQAEIELVQLEKDIKASRAEQEQAKKEKAAAEKSIAKDDAKLKEGMALLQKLRGENEALRKLRDEQVAKIASLDQKSAETQLALENGKRELEKGKLDLKAAQERLARAELENNKRKTDMISQLEQLKVQHKTNKEKTDATEKEILEKRRAISRKEEEVKTAESEVKAGESRLKDAEDRLKELNAQAKGKEGELQRREFEAVKNLESREAKEALVAVKSAQAGTTLASTRTLNGEQNMKVELRAPASAKMIMSKDCSVFEKADVKSKSLGKKKAGTALSGRVSGDWVGYTLKDQRVVFVQKSCF